MLLYCDKIYIISKINHKTQTEEGTKWKLYKSINIYNASYFVHLASMDQDYNKNKMTDKENLCINQTLHRENKNKNKKTLRVKETWLSIMIRP